MSPFRLDLPATVRFGPGAFAELPGLARGYGRRVLLVTGAAWLERSGRLARLVTALSDAALAAVRVPGGRADHRRRRGCAEPRAGFRSRCHRGHRRRIGAGHREGALGADRLPTARRAFSRRHRRHAGGAGIDRAVDRGADDGRHRRRGHPERGTEGDAVGAEAQHALRAPARGRGRGRSRADGRPSACRHRHVRARRPHAARGGPCLAQGESVHLVAGTRRLPPPAGCPGRTRRLPARPRPANRRDVRRFRQRHRPRQRRSRSGARLCGRPRRHVRHPARTAVCDLPAARARRERVRHTRPRRRAGRRSEPGRGPRRMAGRHGAPSSRALRPARGPAGVWRARRPGADHRGWIGGLEHEG